MIATQRGSPYGHKIYKPHDMRTLVAKHELVRNDVLFGFDYAALEYEGSVRPHDFQKGSYYINK